jgi:hypothetical protein
MPLKIIGAGLGRTGTLSVKIALEQLGFGPCYHMMEVMMHPECIPLWMRAADGNADWESIFKGYAATVDYPGCSFWRELSNTYPDAKVLLTVRDPEQWFESTQATIFSPTAIESIRTTPMAKFMEKTVWRDFGDRIHDREFMVASFKRHNAGVQSAIPKDRLLVYEVAQGWEPLCKFLEVPVPSTPFPRRNSREEMMAMIASHTNGDANPKVDFERLQQTLKSHLKGS